MILVAYIVADAPGVRVMFEAEGHMLHGLLTEAGWTALSAALPLVLGFTACVTVAFLWRAVAEE